jgi:cytochrome c553
MQKKSLVFALTVLFSSGVAPVQAQMTHADSANAGKQKSASCESCHGEHGNSTMPMFPKLAGQHATYLVQVRCASRSDDGRNCNDVNRRGHDQYCELLLRSKNYG